MRSREQRKREEIWLGSGRRCRGEVAPLATGLVVADVGGRDLNRLVDGAERRKG